MPVGPSPSRTEDLINSHRSWASNRKFLKGEPRADRRPTGFK